MVRSWYDALDQGETMIDLTMWLLDRLADLARFIGRWP